jgi:hypothetical protein
MENCRWKFLWLLLLVLMPVVCLRAERIVPVPFTISATLYFQSTRVGTNGDVIITGPTVAYQLTPGNLLKNLAQAEYAESNYPAATFPKDAKLYYLVDLDDSARNRFCVLDMNLSVIADVSDILTFSGDGNDGTHKGGFNTANGTLANATYAYMAVINYDDTSAPGGKMKYYLTGLYADKENDVVNSLAGNFTRTIDLKSLCVSGSGTFDGRNLSGGGVASGKGSATLSLK